MDYKIGEWVVHCTYGMGQVVALEERTMNDKPSMYYVIQTSDLTIWVPDDKNIQSRLRAPINATSFKAIISILSEPAEKLPDDYRQRTLQLQSMLREGGAEARVRVIRDLTAYRHRRTWSDHDRDLIKSTEKVLIGEWSYSLSITPAQAQTVLQQTLTKQID